nr:hypothetical protein [Tanacetum cinerariifolium]
MDDPNITMKEYIRLKEEKAQRNFEAEFPTIVFGNTSTTLSNTKQGMVMGEYDTEREDSKIEILAMVLNNTPMSEVTHSYEPTVSPPDENKIDFEISLDESDNEDYMVIFDEIHFPIVYNDGLMSKPDLETKPLVSSEHISELKTSVPRYDEEERNNLYFNDLFLFNVIHPDDLKSEKDNDDKGIDKIHIIRMVLTRENYEGQDMAPLPAADQRHPWLRYQIERYTVGIRHSYEHRLEMIWSRPVNRVYVLDFEGLNAEIRHDLVVRLRMVYTGEGQHVFMSHA